jgi:hypothetical protein
MENKDKEIKMAKIRARFTVRRRGRAWIRAVVNPESTPTFKDEVKA